MYHMFHLDSYPARGMLSIRTIVVRVLPAILQYYQQQSLTCLQRESIFVAVVGVITTSLYPYIFGSQTVI